jgi:phage-related protein
MKPIRFWATALADLIDFPQTARREAGHQLDRVQLAAARYAALLVEQKS